MSISFGPTSPKCSHTDAEPGPPLNTNVTGRSSGRATPSLTYDVVKKLAVGFPALSLR